MYDGTFITNIDHLSVDRRADRPGRSKPPSLRAVDPKEVLRVSVESTSIALLAYYPRTRELDVTFSRGAQYRYLDVPERTFQDFIAASSKGAYFNAVIRTGFRYARI
jgi:hypothetical protein